MAEQIKLCPGCGGEPFAWGQQYHPRMNVECSECSFKALTADWHRRTPGPATKAILEWLDHVMRTRGRLSDSFDPGKAQAFLAEWIERRE